MTEQKEQLETCIEKLRWHALRAEQIQEAIEFMESQATAKAVGAQTGRMARKDGTVISEGYMADTLLRDNHAYRSLVSNRNAHMAQIQMYSALVVAGIERTGIPRRWTGSSYKF